MRRLLRHRNRLALIGGAVVPLLVAAILVPFRGTFASTAAALVMVCVILAAAVSGTRLAGGGGCACGGRAVGFSPSPTRMPGARSVIDPISRRPSPFSWSASS